MTQTRLWNFSIHAEYRGASRLKLILDDKAKHEISRQLDNAATLITERGGRHIYEISVFGVRVVAVCNVARRGVITLMEAKRWYHRLKHGRSRNMKRTHGRKPKVDDFEDDNNGSDR